MASSTEGRGRRKKKTDGRTSYPPVGDEGKEAEVRAVEGQEPQDVAEEEGKRAPDPQKLVDRHLQLHVRVVLVIRIQIVPLRLLPRLLPARRRRRLLQRGGRRRRQWRLLLLLPPLLLLHRLLGRQLPPDVHVVVRARRLALLLFLFLLPARVRVRDGWRRGERGGGGRHGCLLLYRCWGGWNGVEVRCQARAFMILLFIGVTGR